ncbi:MAG: hypothetical protein WC966_08245 [Bradymonadales bacterium]|jgi:hypothetical protein
MAKKKAKQQAKQSNVAKEASFQVDAFAELQRLVKEEKRSVKASEIQEQKKFIETKAPKLKDEPISTKRVESYSEFEAIFMTQEEEIQIFEQSVISFDEQDIYRSKFGQKETITTKTHKETRLELSDEEREFAIFTGEMLRSGVKRLDSKKGETKKRKLAKAKSEKTKKTNTSAAVVSNLQPEITLESKENEKNTKIQENIEEINENDSKILDEKKSVLPETFSKESQADAKKTSEASPAKAVLRQALSANHENRVPQKIRFTPSHTTFLTALREYEKQYGEVLCLRLRNYTVRAAKRRIAEFITALCEDKKKYGQLLVQDNALEKRTGDFKRSIAEFLQADSRVLEHCELKKGQVFYLRLSA